MKRNHFSFENSRPVSREHGFTMIELLVAMLIFTILSFAVYRTTWQYFKAYMKTDDKLENLTEAWQVLRIIKEDLAFADFPSGDRNKWRDLRKLDTNSLLVYRRFDSTLKPITYSFDLKAGNLSRTEDTGKAMSILRQRLKNLTLEIVTRPDSSALPVDQLPQAVSLKLRLELAKKVSDPNKVTPLILEATVVPVFANARLQSRYCYADLPADLSVQPTP